ncbi:MAG: hypothetical protein GEU83_15020 [Pseudonocardiaceae bacterium]|nr:hypothetical protein [Pseudonocardiaceae bacterium]
MTSERQVSRQDLADAEMLQSFLDAELRPGLEAALEDQILSGDGLGENFEGLATVSGAVGGPPWGWLPRRSGPGAVVGAGVCLLRPGWRARPPAR